MKEEKKKVKTAVALSYDEGDEAPRVVASGKGAVAERIVESAKDNDVPIHEDSQLAGTLAKLEIGEAIPPQLYEVVAEVLVFVDYMDRKKKKEL